MDVVSFGFYGMNCFEHGASMLQLFFSSFWFVSHSQSPKNSRCGDRWRVFCPFGRFGRFERFGRLGSWVFLFLLGWGTTGCSLIPASPYDVRVEPGLVSCQSQLQCLAGQTCENGKCQAIRNDDTHLISLQIIPPHNHTFTDPELAITKQHIVGITPAVFNGQGIQTRVAYNVSGKIYARDGQNKEIPVPAKIRFLDLNSIPGNQLTWEITTDPRQTVTAAYRHSLTQGTYLMEIWPQDSNWPPHRLEFLVRSSLTQSIQLPGEQDYVRLKGRVLSADSRSAPMSGLKLQVMSQDDRPLSKTFTTDEHGQFSIWLRSDSLPHHIRILQRDLNMIHPQVDIPYQPASLQAGEVAVGDLNVGLGKTTIRVSGHVVARQQDGGYTIANANIRIIGEIDAGTYQGKVLKGQYILNVRSDSNGRYEAELLPGQYHFEVIPPADSDRSRAYIVPTKTYFHENREVDLELSPKRRILGKICQKGNNGNCENILAHAQIQALWRNPLPQTQTQLTHPTPAIPTTPFLTELSRSDGTYELSLDPGYYDFIYVPPADSGLARLIRTSIEVNNDTAQPYIQFDALLSKARYFVGQLIGPDKNPMPNATVEMYSHTQKTEQTSRLLGRAVTNSQGFFSIPYHTATPN